MKSMIKIEKNSFLDKQIWSAVDSLKSDVFYGDWTEKAESYFQLVL